MNPVKTLKSRLFPKGVRRAAQRYSNRILARTTLEKLKEAFQQLGMERGAVICVHSMLSGLGHIVDGPQTVIRALRQAVPGCTIMMPTFPFDGSAVDYLKQRPVFDPMRSPSRSGLLTEVLRQFPETLRSIHPTHPCAALGPKAGLLIEGSEKSLTPFGDNSTYGRFSELDEAVMLLIHTNNPSIVHRIQEMVDMPNLFLQDPAQAKGLDNEENVADYTVRIHTSLLPLYIIMPGDREGELEYVWFPDYALLLPEYNRSRILTKLRSKKAKKILLDRHKYFVDNGTLQIIKIREAEIIVIRVKPWIERLCRDIRQGIVEFQDKYTLEQMQYALQKGRLSKF
jgi:aminoglycoside N3'-acetyltransferase